MNTKSPQYAIYPIDTCPHDAEHVNLNGIIYLKQLYQDPHYIHHCSKCNCIENLWLCCECFYLFCGRDQNQHMIQHAQSTQHILCCSLEDLSFWCFGPSDDCIGCDYYINEFTNPNINILYEAICYVY